MKYRFVNKNGGWWLKISTIDELMSYYEVTKLQNPIARGFRSVMNCREFGRPIDGEPLKPHVNGEGYAIGLRAYNKNTSLMESALSLAAQMDDMQVRAINNGENVYFNSKGGWHSSNVTDYNQWYDSDKMIFPDFNKNQIKIEKFPMGNHYYAYIDSMQVRDGDILKWNTYEEAYNIALKYISVK